MTCKDCVHYVVCAEEHICEINEISDNCKNFMKMPTMDAKDYLIKRSIICIKHVYTTGECNNCPLSEYNCGNYDFRSVNSKADDILSKAIEIVKNYKLEDENNV